MAITASTASQDREQIGRKLLPELLMCLVLGDKRERETAPGSGCQDRGARKRPAPRLSTLAPETASRSVRPLRLMMNASL